jgi:hypothetical protein
MEIESKWYGTILIPQNDIEIKILQELWNVLPE